MKRTFIVNTLQYLLSDLFECLGVGEYAFFLLLLAPVGREWIQRGYCKSSEKNGKEKKKKLVKNSKNIQQRGFASGHPPDY
jgi:hypothetical protein